MKNKDHKLRTLKKESYREEIINGPITSTLMKLAWPIMITNGMQVLYNIADTFWVGKISAQAVAAISISFPVVFLFISIGAGINISGTTLVAQYTGAGESENADKVATQLFVFIFSLSVILSFIGYLFNENILHLIGAPENIMDQATGYLNIFFIGLPFMFLFFVFSALLRGVGDTKTPMKMMIISVLINIVADPFIIFGWSFFPELGVRGAALATISSRAIAGLFGMYLLFSGKKGIHIKKKYLKPDLKMYKKILRIGIPSAGEKSMAAISIVLFMGIISRFGTMAVAAYGIGHRVMSIVRMPVRGFGRGTTTMVGQNLGADKIDRAERCTWIATAITFISLILIWIGVFIFSEQIIAIFNNNPEVVKIGSSFLKIAGFSFSFIGIRLVIGSGFRGAGNTLIAMILAIIALIILRIPLSYFLSVNLNWGINGVWWGMLIANAISAIIGIIWFQKGTWKEKEV
ncbi:MAG TPA: MATE family efflux transporter [Halanaerobiales bacterium]|nr:MATE family efflux transporter [Halanaerobiales bacterium]